MPSWAKSDDVSKSRIIGEVNMTEIERFSYSLLLNKVLGPSRCIFFELCRVVLLKMLNFASEVDSLRAKIDDIIKTGNVTSLNMTENERYCY